MKVVWERNALADFRHLQARSPRLASRVVDTLTIVKCRWHYA